MSPYLTPVKMENPIQTLPASPQLASQGYGGQLQSSPWSGSPIRQNTQSQSPNMEPYPQQMTRYYQGSYNASQHSSDVPHQYMGSSAANSHHSTASTPYNAQYPPSRQNNYPGSNVPQNYVSTVKPNYGSYYNTSNPQTPGYPVDSQRQTNYTASTYYPQKSSQCIPPSVSPQMQPHNTSIVNSPPSYPKQQQQQQQSASYQRYVNNYTMYQNENQSATNYVGKQLSMPTGGNSSATSLSTITSTQANGQLSSIPTPPETSTPGDLPGGEGSNMDVTSDCIKTNHVSSSSFVLPGSSGGHTTSVSFSSSNIGVSTTLSNSPENTRIQTWNTSGTTAPPLQPPPNVDEGSQASSASASSSIPDEQNSRNTNSKPNFSYPPTPNTLSSPGAASMSSFHDDLECISSPGWPRTPASPVANSTTSNSNTNTSSSYEFANIKRPENLLKLYTLSDEPERRYFLDKLIIFNEDRGSPITQCPTISKQPLDVYRVYISVKERGGFVEVTNAKRWKDIAGAIGVGASSSAAYTLRKQYMKLLLPFECKYDRGGIDPQPIINQVEASSRKKTKNNTQGAQSMYGQGYAHPMDNTYPAGGYSECYPTRNYPPYNANSMDYRYVPSQAACPPPAMHNPSNASIPGQTPYPQYARNSQTPCANYYQGSNPAMAPVYNSPQHSNVPTNVCRYSMNSATSSPVPPTTESGYYPSNYVHSQNYSAPASNSYKYNYSNSSHSSNSANVPASEPPTPNVNTIDSSVKMMHRDQASPYSPYPSTESAQNEKVTQPPVSENVPQVKMETVVETSTENAQSTESSTVPDNASPNNTPTNYNQNFVKKEIPSQEQCVTPVNKCPTPKPAVSPYQVLPPSQAVESNKTFPTNCPSTPPTFNNQNTPSQCTPAPSYNQPAAYQNSYHQKAQTHQTQYGQYINNVNENYRGSEGPPPNFTPPIKYNGMTNSKEALSSVPSSYPCNNFPPKASAYPSNATYSHPPPPPSTPVNKDPYPMSYYGNSNSRPVKGWNANSCYAYQPTSDIPHRPPPTNLSNSPDTKPFVETPRPFPQNKPETVQMDAKVPQPSPMYNIPTHRPQPPPNHMVPPHCFMTALRKPMEFPPDSVEAVKPIYKKRRRYSAKRVSPLDPWRLMLALKSGLLVESTWALDSISVLLCDNSSTVYFRLSHLPGLLSVLIEHYRRFLNKIFDLCDDLEVGCSQKSVVKESSESEQTDKVKTPIKNGYYDKNQGNIFNWLDKTKVLNNSNFTFQTRCKKNVQVQYDEALFLIDPEQNWDKYEGFNVSSEYWFNGNGEITDHIQIPFETITGKVQFARNMDKEKHSTRIDANESCIPPVIVKDLTDRIKDCESNFPKLMLPSKGEPLVVLKKCHVSDNNVDTKLTDEDSLTEPENSEQLCKNMKSESRQSFDSDSLLSDLSKSNSSSSASSENSHLNTMPTIKSNPFSELKKPTENCTEESKSTANDVESINTEDNSDKSKELTFPRLRSPSTMKRSFEEELDDEAYCFDHPSLNLLTEHQDAMIRRCMCVSNILRNLSFVPSNDLEMNKNSCLLLVLGRLLLLHHEHKPLKPTQRKYDKEVEVNTDDSCLSLKDDYEWWQSLLHVLRDNTLVTLSNIAGQLDLSPFPEEISLPLLDGLLHWVTCPSSYARDPIPVKPSFSVLTPQRLALEILCKLSVLDNNVDLMMATPPWSRIERLFEFLARSLSPVQDKAVREFSIVLLSSLSRADSSIARAIAAQSQCISYLIGFIEQAEASAFQIASTQGTKRLRDNPELVGTTPNMILRAATILRNLASVSENRTAFFSYQQRLLTLVTSQIIDQELAGVLAEVLFYCSNDDVGDDQLTLFS